MSNGVVVAIVVVVILLVALAVMAPRLRRVRERRQLENRRGEAVEHHRDEAEQRHVRADLAEKEAERQRAEAELQASRARAHEKGLADERLGGEGETRGRAGR